MMAALKYFIRGFKYGTVSKLYSNEWLNNFRYEKPYFGFSMQNPIQKRQDWLCYQFLTFRDVKFSHFRIECFSGL
jgi:hypothetical protein